MNSDPFYEEFAAKLKRRRRRKIDAAGVVGLVSLALALVFVGAIVWVCCRH